MTASRKETKQRLVAKNKKQKDGRLVKRCLLTLYKVLSGLVSPVLKLTKVEM